MERPTKPVAPVRNTFIIHLLQKATKQPVHNPWRGVHIPLL